VPEWTGGSFLLDSKVSWIIKRSKSGRNVRNTTGEFAHSRNSFSLQFDHMILICLFVPEYTVWKFRGALTSVFRVNVTTTVG
jgi:hypothetical protein